jgi:uncharacterized protein with HEPN domain
VSEKRTYLDALRDIVTYCDIAKSLIEGFNGESFSRDIRTHLAVVRALEVIGEAVRQVPVSARNEYPEVPWAEASATRDKLIHGYFGVNLQVVWDTVHEDLPPLRDAVAQIIENIAED